MKCARYHLKLQPGIFSFSRLVFRLAKGEKGVSERFLLKSPNGWLKTRHREIDNTRRLWV